MKRTITIWHFVAVPCMAAYVLLLALVMSILLLTGCDVSPHGVSGPVTSDTVLLNTQVVASKEPCPLCGSTQIGFRYRRATSYELGGDIAFCNRCGYGETEPHTDGTARGLRSAAKELERRFYRENLTKGTNAIPQP